MFSITFNTDNSAFENELSDHSSVYEISRILNGVIDQVNNGSTGANIRDINGNTIGSWGLI